METPKVTQIHVTSSIKTIPSGESHMVVGDGALHLSKVRRLPHFMIIGVMKSGTGALRTFLRAHSDIVLAFPEVYSNQCFLSCQVRTTTFTEDCKFSPERNYPFFYL